MMRSCALWMGALWLGVIGPVPAFAAAKDAHAKRVRGISFKANPTKVTIGAAKTTRLAMLPWIQGQGANPVFWQINPFSAPNWVQIDEANNVMIVAPPASAVGLARFDLIASTGSEDTAIGKIEVTVRIEPIWTADRIDVGEAVEDVAFSFPLAPKVTVPGGGALTFTWEAGGTRPPWISLSPTGVLSGTPRRSDVGNFGGFWVVASTLSGGTARAEIFGTVRKVLKPPKFLQTGFSIANAFEDAAYTVDISTPTFVSNFENVPLTFTKLEGPAWLGMTNKGVLQGTPNASQVGPVTVRARLEGTLESTLYTSEATFTFNVQPTNDAPVWTLNPVQLPDAKALKPYSGDLRPFVTDEENDPLTFTRVSGPSWATFSPQGLLSGSPPNSALGLNEWAVDVSDGTVAVRATVRVNVTNTPPRWTSNPVILPNAKENALYQQSLTSFVTDENGDALAFTLVSGPPWATVSNNGTISGTPRPANLGLNKFNVRVADGVAGQAVAEVRIFVENVNDAPEWSQNPLVLGPIDERIAFSANLATFVTDPDVGDPHTFVKISGPDWASVSSDGFFAGTPLRPNVGLNVFRVEVSDLAGATAQVDIFITVNKVNQAPVWTAQMLDLPDALEDASFSFNIATFATDEDGDALTFKKVTGPAWLSAVPTGTLSGTPVLADVGNYLASFEVSDGKLTRTVQARGRVVKKPRPPVLNLDQLVFTVKERQELNVSLNDPRFVVAQNNLPLSFQILDPKPWLTLGLDGALVAKPQFPQVGRHELRIRVADSLLSTEGLIVIIVERDARPPVWTNTEILFEAPARTPFSASLVSKVTDLDGIPLTFTKKSGPAWLTVATNGTISGTPADANLGDNAFVVTARNDLLGADKDVTVRVTFKNHEPQIHLEALNFTVKERAKLVVELSDPQYVQDADGDPLQFALVDSAQWVSLDGDGTLILSPKFPQIGVHNFQIRVTDGNYTVDSTITVTVVRDPRPPVWMQDPITFDAKAREAFTATLAGKAVDLDGLKISYTKKSGPDWLTVGTDGVLSGTPSDGNVGDNSFVVTAKNDLAGADVTVIVRVLFNPKPPKLVLTALNFTVKERATLSVDLNDPKYVTHTDPTPLTWTLLTPSDFVTLSPQGALVIKPVFKDIGPHTFAIRATNAGLSDEGPLVVTVVRDPRPPVWSENPIRFETPARVLFSTQLKQKIQDLDGLPLTFVKTSGATWLTVGQDGTLSGTPTDAQVGEHTLVVTASNDKLGADVTIVVKVLFSNHAPAFSQNPVKLPDAFVAEAYAQSIRSFVTDADSGDVLTFEKVSGANWAAIGSNGQVTGTPAAGDVGLATLRVRVSDGAGGTAETDVQITVRPQNQPPVWANDPLDLGNAVEDALYTFDLKPKVSDADGNPLTLTIVSAPAWLTLSQSGVLSGTPRMADVGPFTATFAASDGKLTTQVRGNGRVLRKNVPPTFPLNTIILTVKERQVLTVNLNDPQYVGDENGDALTFTMTPVAQWTKLATNGGLEAKPLHAQVGDNDFQLTVSDGKLSATATLRIRVLPDPRPPVWSQNPINLGDALEDSVFRFDLKPLVTEPDGNPLTLTIVSAPAWLTIANGVLSGTPRLADVGNYTATFAASNGTQTVSVVGNGRVIRKNVPPTFPLQTIVLSVKERQRLTVNLNDPQFVSDANGDTLTFSMTPAAQWVQLATNGSLDAKPLHPQVGDHDFNLTVSDGKLTGTATLRIRVLPDPQPPKWERDPLTFETLAREVFRVDLKPFVTDPDGVTLAFTKKSGPGWLTVGGDGVISGTPADPDVGENAFVVTARNETLGADVNVVIKVLFNNHPPEWKQDPIDLPDAFVGQSYNSDVGPFARDPDTSDVLTFSRQAGPNWLQVGVDGKVSGTPLLANVGVNTFQVRVSDPGSKFAVVTVRIRVIKPNTPPKWSEDPIRLADARAETTYVYDVAPFVQDDDGDVLTFRKISGPNWLQVGADGKLGGTPSRFDVGDYVTVLEVTDNKNPAVRVNAVGRVLPKANPPIIHQDTLFFVVKERSTLDVDLDQKKYVEDLDNLPLSFELVDVAPWVSLSQRGRLLAQPFFPQIGDHEFKFRVTNNQFLGEGIIHIKVVRDPRPPVWSQNPIRFRAKAREPFSATLADKVTDPDGQPLTFAKKFGADWLSIDAKGNLFGTPQPDVLGENTFLVTAKNDAVGSDVTVIVFVENNNNAPFWVESPIRLPDARIDKDYLQTVEPFARDPDPGDKLKFKKLAGPDWIFVGEGGTVLGKPGKLDEGVASMRIRITDPWNLWADVTVIIHVTAPSAPRWLKDPIPLGDVRVGNLYGYDISPFAVSDEGLPLTFSKVSGPGWLQVMPNGRLAGRPAVTDVGPYTAIFAVSDGRYVAQATGYGRVLPAQNSGPVFEQNPISFTMKEREKLTENLNQRKYIYDPDGDPMTMELVGAAPWTVLTAAGQLTLTPQHPEVGEHTFTIRVKDDKGNTTEGKLYVRVLPDAQAPLWLQDPIRFTTYVNKPFVQSISDKAKDPDGKQLAFGKVSGPEWLVVAPNGGLSGLPILSNLGENTFRVFAKNDAKQAEVAVIITVLKDDPITDSLGVDDAVPGAPTENIWVIDNSYCGTGYSPVVNGLRSAIRTYYNLLDQAKVQSTGVYLSSDAKTYDGRPLRDPAGEMLFFWKDANLIENFQYRLVAPHSGYCYSSPIWATYRFQKRVPTEWPFYKKDFIRDRVPQDVLMATIHPDYFSYYAQGRPEQNWGADQYADSYLSFAAREKQSLRVSVVAPQCKQMLASEREAMEDNALRRGERESVPVPLAAPSAYARIVDKTKGEFLALNCQVDYDAVARRYAQQVIFRAYVYAKQRISLTKKPLDAAEIEVRLGGKILDKASWTYDAATNSIAIDWLKIDVSALKPGDRIEIKYRS